MADDWFNPLLYMLEALVRIDLGNCDDLDEECEEESYIFSRGLSGKDRAKKDEIQNRLKLRKRKRTILQKVDYLKELLPDLVQKRDDTTCISLLASFINDILDPKQKEIFMTKINNHEYSGSNPEYINFLPNSQNYSPTLYEYDQPCLTARCGEPQNSIFQSCNLDSMSINGDDEAVKLPIEKRYNISEAYLIHKGIHYCKMQLSEYNKASDYGFAKELGSNDVLNLIMSANINNEKSYITKLANEYPKTIEEIKFLIKNNKELILKSSIFVNIAQNNIQHLYEFLSKLSSVVDKNDLSRACDQSQFGEITVTDILKQNFSTENKGYADKISKFLNRYKSIPSY